MKTVYLGLATLCVMCVLSSRAFCAWQQASVRVTGSYSVVDPLSGESQENQDAPGRVVTDPNSVSFDWDVQQYGAGSASVTFSGSASAGDGRLGVRANAAASADFPSYGIELGGQGSVYGVVDAYAQSYLADTLTFEPPTPDMVGDYFQVETYWNLHGSIIPIVTGGNPPTNNSVYNTQAVSSANLYVQGTGIDSVYSSQAAAGDVVSVDAFGNMSQVVTPTPTTIPVVIDGYWGVPQNVGFELSLHSYAFAQTGDIYYRTGAAANVDADFSHTLSWGGITTITDANGNPVPAGWSVTSTSGYDWSQAAVPEPSSAVLCGIGAMLVIAASRRMAKRRRYQSGELLAI